MSGLSAEADRAAAMLMLDEDAPPLAMPLAFASLSDRANDALRERARQAARAMTASDVTYDGEFDVTAASLLIRTFGEKNRDDARRAIIADAKRSPWSFFFRFIRITLRNARNRPEPKSNRMKAIGELTRIKSMN